MELQLNLANVIRTMKDTRSVLLAEFSAGLDISCSTLLEYLSGAEKPKLSTIEHLAHKLEVDSIDLLASVLTCDGLQAWLIIVDQMFFQSQIDRTARILFAQKNLEIEKLWNGDVDDG